MGNRSETRAERRAEEARDMETIVAAHESALLRYAAGLLRSREAAQDVVQNAFIKLFRAWQPGQHPTDALRNWLYRVTHNEAVDYIRREARLGLLHARAQKEDPPDPASGTAESAARMEAVLANLRRLHPTEQQVILLRLQEGFSYKEIARVTGRTEGNVGCVLHNAVKKLSSMVARKS